MRKILAWALLAAMILVPASQAFAAGLTLSFTYRLPIGNVYLVVGTIDFDDSYPTGGEALTPGNIGLNTIDYFDANADLDGYVMEYDYSAEKLLVYGAAGDTVAAAPLIQVLDTTDLVAVTDVKFIAIGRD